VLLAIALAYPLAHGGRKKIARFRDWICDEARRARERIDAGGF